MPNGRTATVKLMVDTLTVAIIPLPTTTQDESRCFLKKIEKPRNYNVITYT